MQRPVVVAPDSEDPLEALEGLLVESAHGGLELLRRRAVLAHGSALEEEVAAVKKYLAWRQPELAVPPMGVGDNRAAKALVRVRRTQGSRHRHSAAALHQVDNLRFPYVSLLPASKEEPVAEGEHAGFRGVSKVAHGDDPAHVDHAVYPGDLILHIEGRQRRRELGPHPSIAETHEGLSRGHDCPPGWFPRRLHVAAPIELELASYVAHGHQQSLQHDQHGPARPHLLFAHPRRIQDGQGLLADLGRGGPCAPAICQLPAVLVADQLGTGGYALGACGWPAVPWKLPDAHVPWPRAIELHAACALAIRTGARRPAASLLPLAPTQEGLLGWAGSLIDWPALDVEAVEAVDLLRAVWIRHLQLFWEELHVDLFRAAEYLVHLSHELQGCHALVQVRLRCGIALRVCRSALLVLLDSLASSLCQLVAQQLGA
mmetsp:Transcript_10895/g.24687  ORF Transcript_10895/g.24687 Transcript_10895/m.24687 type:complete len:430 (+) Transcript_10895:754-2043(+)